MNLKSYFVLRVKVKVWLKSVTHRNIDPAALLHKYCNKIHVFIILVHLLWDVQQSEACDQLVSDDRLSPVQNVFELCVCLRSLFQDNVLKCR